MCWRGRLYSVLFGINQDVRRRADAVEHKTSEIDAKVSMLTVRIQVLRSLIEAVQESHNGNDF